MSKFIYCNKTEKSLLKLSPVEFEWLIELLYINMGYETQWTTQTRDGGKDIIAKIKRTDGWEYVYEECKRYTKTNLSNETVRAIIGTIITDKINRGVIFCTGHVSENLKNYDKRIQIWTLEEIIFLLNSHLGSDWPKRLTVLIENQRIKHKK
ncbi:hypothetical protein SDC9_173918 [bioreactor metagenome]|uniref:Restriction endonuclease type IV Mrr domain-containing protein n=1 Tax=bioreactor metagenome TaxID=1076179 RepID=A0A645GS84_9ZZZZ